MNARAHATDGNRCRLRVAFVAPRYHTNQHFAVKALRDEGCDVAFFALYRGPTEEHSALEPLILGDGLVFRALLRVFRPKSERDFRIEWGCPPLRPFWHALKSFDPDVVVVRAAAYPFFLMALLLTRLLNRQTIILTMGPKHTDASKMKRLKAWILSRAFRADWMTHVEGDARRFAPWNPRVHYLPCPIEVRHSDLGQSWGFRQPVRILAVGKFERRKNHPLMVDAFHLVSQQSTARLTIVGECSSSRHNENLKLLREQILRKGLDQSIDLMTNLSFEQMENIYASHDLFVLASSDEPLGVVLIEAMAHSLPVICSDSAGCQWYVEPGGNGYVFKTGGLDDLVRVLKLILEDPMGFVKMGQRSLELVKLHHSPGSYASELMKIADSLAIRRHHA